MKGSRGILSRGQAVAFVTRIVLVLLAIGACAACGGTPPARVAEAPGSSTQAVFEVVVPSVVAVLNDDDAIRAEEAKAAMREMGVEAHAPKTVIDVSLRKEPMPHGTGFVVEGGLVVTAAHVIHSPERLKLTTRTGQTVDADLVHIDEVRDVAILQPKTPLKGAVPIKLAEQNPPPGKRVWALGHTGNGLWALSWGISEGIASGIVDLLGAKLLLFDAPVYPGFSGGPVVTLDPNGKPAVVGVNHAILFLGGSLGTTVATISSASSVPDIKDAIAKKPAAIESTLAAYAKTKATEARAELFITRNLSVHRDPHMLTTAAISGNERTIEAGSDDIARVPVVSMLFGLPKGSLDVTFELEDPDDVVVERLTKRVKVGDHDRVAFATADFRFDPKVAGRYDVVARSGGKIIGRTDVWIEDPDDDDQPVDDDDQDDDDEGPHVDVVVATYGHDDPLSLSGIRSGWVEWRYPRRVAFNWFARGSRGWSGTNVAISAFVLDEGGKIVGRGVGCMRSEVRPEKPWSCAGQGGTPLLTREGRYDVVFAMNDRPIAIWPMEAMVRMPSGTSALDKWVSELKKQHQIKHHKGAPAPAPVPAPKPKTGDKPEKADKPEKPAPPKPKPKAAPSTPSTDRK